MPGPSGNKILSEAQGLSKVGLEVKAAGAPAQAKLPKTASPEHILPVRVGGKPRQGSGVSIKFK